MLSTYRPANSYTPDTIFYIVRTFNFSWNNIVYLIFDGLQVVNVDYSLSSFVIEVIYTYSSLLLYHLCIYFFLLFQVLCVVETVAAMKRKTFFENRDKGILPHYYSTIQNRFRDFLIPLPLPCKVSTD